MSIQTEKPFSLVRHWAGSSEDGPRAKIRVLLPYQIEGFNKTAFCRWDRKYSGTQEQVDQKAGVDGYAGRRDRELRSFQRHVEQDLKTKGRETVFHGRSEKLRSGQSIAPRLQQSEIYPEPTRKTLPHRIIFVSS